MKTLLTFTETHLLIQYKGSDYPFARTGATLNLTETEAAELIEPLALILVLLSGSRKFFLEKPSYFALRERIWTLLDRDAGGLNDIGQQCYGADEAVMEAAAENRTAVQKLIAEKKGKPTK